MNLHLRWIGLVSAFIILSLLDASIAKEESKKHAVPNAAMQKDKEVRIKKLFDDDYANANSASTNIALANKLFTQAAEIEDDIVGKYVLLREARDAAIDAGDAAFALQMVNEIDTFFDIESVKMKFETLNSIRKSARSGDQKKALAHTAAALVDQAVKVDDYETAQQLGDLAHDMARQSRDRTLSKAMATRNKEIEELAAAYANVKIALATLEKQPTDSDANLTAGQFLCFRKGDWEQGLPMLAQCPDPDLKALAKMETAGPKTEAEQVKLADEWWKLSETYEKETQIQAQIQIHAAGWYQRALTNLTGLEKLRVQKRLDELPVETDELATKLPMTDKAQIVELSSAPGIKFEMQEDSSFYVNGPNPNSADYTMLISTGKQTMLGLRLETLTDERLPNGGPGRRSNGNYILTDFQVYSADENGEFTKRIAIAGALANYSQPGFEVAHAIDAHEQTGWSVGPKVGNPHWSAFQFAIPVESKSLIKVVLLQRNPGGYNIGRFRMIGLTKNGASVLAEKPTIKSE